MENKEKLKACFFEKFENSFLKVEGKKLNYDEITKNNYSKIFRYFFEESLDGFIHETSKIRLKPSFKKGLFVFGDFGVGKTALFRTLKDIFCGDINGNQFKIENKSNSFLFKNSLQLLNEFQVENEYKHFFERYSVGNLCIDEVFKDNVVNNYGTKTNVISEIVSNRYERISNGKKMYLISNYSDKGNKFEDILTLINEKYGTYVLERIIELCNFVEFKGESKRYTKI